MASTQLVSDGRPAEMNPGDFHTFDVSAQFLFVGCSDGRILRLELETGEERYSNDLGGGGVQEIVISRSGETFAAVCDDCKVRIFDVTSWNLSHPVDIGRRLP